MRDTGSGTNGTDMEPRVPSGEGPTPWQVPSPAIRELVDAPPFPSLLLSPTREHLALARRPRHPSLIELTRPELRLAGLRIDPARHDQSRREPFTSISLTALTSLDERIVSGLPDAPRLGNASFSPDGKHLAFTHVADGGLEVWVVDVASAEARRLATGPFSAVLAAPYRWLPDGCALVCLRVPGGAAPEGPEVPEGPIVMQNDGRETPARTYQDLLESPHDEALFEHYATTEPVRLGLDGTERAIGEPAMYASISASPDGEYLLVQTLRRPFSYRVPAGRFPLRVEVRRVDGSAVVTIADLPLADAIPITFDSVRDGRRSITWRPDADAELVFVEAQDGGDAARDVEVRDRVYLLTAPFDAPPRELAALGLRYGWIAWGDDDTALIGEWWWTTRREKVWRIAPAAATSNGPGDPHLLFDRSFQDRYHAPGSPAMRPTRRGRSVMHIDGRRIFLVGEGASPDGDHPFLDALDLDTGKTSRLWRSSPPGYQYPAALLDPSTLTVILRHERPDEPPNYSVTTLVNGGETIGARKPVTAFTHPAPQMREATKELIRYSRRDGLELSGTLHLPAGYDATRDGTLPLILWAYPQPFKSSDTAEQVRAAPHRWDPIWWSSPLIWLTEGFAVLDDPSMPIVGEGETEPNDTYVEQLVMNAEAAVDAVVARGVVDRERIAVGGHSYGAFMTAHLLAHTRLFRAGVARSGSYNRTLTPFGFQTEERNLWQAPDVYAEMSAFGVADRIEAPLLLIHGQADNNPGTYPEQTERLYDALKGLGATVRLVLLPHESHGYRARESVLHVLWEMTEWLRVHLGR